MAHIKDIIGCKKEVKKLESICDFLKNTDKYIDYNIKLPNSLLICGKEGVGKTYIAEALIADSQREIFNYNGNGNNVKLIKSIFKKAKKSANSIIFIDDLDYITLDDDCPVYERLFKRNNWCILWSIKVIPIIIMMFVSSFMMKPCWTITDIHFTILYRTICSLKVFYSF